MDLPLVPSSLHIFLVLPGIHPAALLSRFLPVFLSLVELGNSHAMELHSPWCEEEGEAKTLRMCVCVWGGIPLPVSKPWRPLCPWMLRETNWERQGGFGEVGSLSNPHLTFLPELICKCLIHSVPSLVPPEPTPILSLGHRAGIFSGNSGNSHAHNPMPRGSATYLVPIRHSHLYHLTKPHTRSL